MEMAYTGNMDFSKLIRPTPVQTEDEMLNSMYRKGGITNQLSIEQQMAEQGFAERYGRIKNNPAFIDGYDKEGNPIINPYYKYTTQDMQQWQKGISSRALEKAKLIKQEAEMFGIPLEEYDPNNPHLLPYFADNPYDSERIMNHLNNDMPQKYQIARNPANDSVLEKLSKFASNIMFGNHSLDQVTYDMSREKAIDQMMKDGLTGEQIEQVLQANELRQNWNKDNAKGLDKIIYQGDTKKIWDYYLGQEAQKGADAINKTASTIWDKFLKTEVGKQFASDMEVSKDTWKRYFGI
jgi:hypothetical protein